VGSEQLATMMISLEAKGCHNINLVSPTHVVPQILTAVELAIGMGMSIPLVYNTGGYDSVETIKLLDDIIDIYMPDMKYSDEKIAKELSGISGYPKANRLAITEMHRQVGDLEIDERGVAQHGLLVRHLVMPQGLAGTAEVVRFLSQEISTQTYLNIMDQYHPKHKAFQVPSLSRPLLHQEFTKAVNLAHQHGLGRLDRLAMVS